jgi:hypothetical protein
VLQETVAAMTNVGAVGIVASLGPCIRPCCYEFGRDDLDTMASRFGPRVRSQTRQGTPAMDMPAGVRAALAEVGVDLVAEHGACTACDPGWYSHRARREIERQATLVWLPGGPR